jgi:O-antigen/teichoic acid export membrane protein
MRTVSFGTLLMASGKTRQVAIGNLISLLATALFTIPLVYAIGYIGAAVAMIVGSYFFELLYYLYLLRRIFTCRLRSLFPWGRLWKITWSSAGGLAVLSAVKLLLGIESNILVLATCSICFLATTSLLLIYNKVVDPSFIWNKILPSNT